MLLIDKIVINPEFLSTALQFIVIYCHMLNGSKLVKLRYLPTNPIINCFKLVDLMCNQAFNTLNLLRLELPLVNAKFEYNCKPKEIGPF
jgi:hypothetical protein